jgi:hypothetical protein
MDLYAALEEVRRWCAEQTAAGDPDRVEVECHPDLSITIGESAPPWRVRWERRSSAGASSPVAQLRYDIETGEWALHHGGLPGESWCSDEEAVRCRELGPLLEEIANDRDGRFEGLPEIFYRD